MTHSVPLVLRALETRERPLPEALALGGVLAAAARSDQGAWIAASVVRGPAVVLGAAQRAGRVLDLGACTSAGVSVYRRSTTGTAGFVGDAAVLFTLALSRVSALAPDATARTLLNRNVRGFLQGLTRAGALAHYFGREWIAVRHRPAALLGFEVDADGVVRLEVLAGLSASIALPSEIVSAHERGLKRWRGRAPIALGEVLAAARTPVELAELVVESVARRAGVALEPSARPPAPPAPASRANFVVTDPNDPLPAELTPAPPLAVPIGAVEAAAGRHDAGVRVWLGGDVLAPTCWLDAVARAVAEGHEVAAEPDEVPLEGARYDDLVKVARAAVAGLDSREG